MNTSVQRGGLCLALAVALWLALGVAGCQRRSPAEEGAVAPPLAPPSHTATSDEYWQNALEEVYKTPPELLAQHEAELRRGLRYPKVLRGAPGRREVALTFDDGPHTKYTPQLLAVLAKYHAPATFLVVGELAEQHPDLIKAELAGGHNVGNHTYHHVNLTKIPQRLVAAEITACDDVIRNITGTPPHLFRPPGGDYNARVAETVAALDHTLVLWTDDPGDYASPGAKVIEDRVLRMIGNGGIILLHDGVQQTVDILPQLLEYLRARGLRTVTIDEMLAHAPPSATRSEPGNTPAHPVAGQGKPEAAPKH